MQPVLRVPVRETSEVHVARWGGRERTSNGRAAICSADSGAFSVGRTVRLARGGVVGHTFDVLDLGFYLLDYGTVGVIHGFSLGLFVLRLALAGRRS